MASTLFITVPFILIVILDNQPFEIVNLFFKIFKFPFGVSVNDCGSQSGRTYTEMIYPAQTRNVPVSTPPTELPRTAYPLLVNAFETIVKELIGFYFSKNIVRTRAVKIMLIRSKISFPS